MLLLKKTIVLTFEYYVNDLKDFRRISGNTNDGKTCNYYNGDDSTLCQMSAPKINLGGKNLKNQNISDLFSKVVWRASDGHLCGSGGSCSVNTSKKFTPYLVPNSNYVNNSSLYAYGHNPVNVWIRNENVIKQNSTNDAQQYGVTCNYDRFYWDGEYSVALDYVWLRGYTNSGWLKGSGQAICSNNTKRRVPHSGSGWSTSQLIIHN